MANSIVAEPLNPQSGFNWVFLVELLICGILTVFFLFYFNRLFATVISYGIRAYTWRAYHAYIDIQALQISLLGGRIFFKDIRYHGHNETILIHGGYITWNYWLRRVKDPDVYTERGTDEDNSSQTPSSGASRSGSRSRNADGAEKGGKQPPKKLPCRISVKVQGVEAFMYNRSPAYDGIIEAMQRKMKVMSQDEKPTPPGETTGGEEGSINGSVDAHSGEKHHNKLKKAVGKGESGITRADTDQSTASETKKKPELPSFLRILPIHIDCAKGAVVIGNENTMAVITAQCEKASGELNASPSGPLDVYQQIFSFQFTHPVVHMKPNPDFKTTQLEAAARIKQEANNGVLEEDISEKSIRPKKHRYWIGSFPGLSGLFSKSTDSINTHSKSNVSKTSRSFTPQWRLPGQERWKGLSRYLDQTQNDGHGEWDGVEYAKASLIADCPCVNFSIYWDVPGPVPNEIDNSMHIDPARPKDINGSTPPEYGMDLQIFGGIINYGPWADRHRGIFQSMFFPGAHVDADPASPLKAGQTRVLSVFKLDLSIEDDTVLRIPVRETSKDWRWKGKAHTLAGNQTDKTKGKPRYRKRTMRGKQRDTTATAQNVRPYAWIDIKVTGNSSISYVMDMVASQTGYQNKLSVNILGSEIFSSVNHGLLWRSGLIGLDCDLSNPISWNTLRKWMFNISCRDLELFLLRDHLFLLIDLVADWGSGPPSDYFTFVPFQYLLNIDLIDFKLYLNTNDGNIVNNPSDLDDNNFLTLFGQKIHGDVIIPLDKFRPLQNEIKFDVKGQDLGLNIDMPSKNTLKTFVRNRNLAQLGSLTLTGSHTYMSETSAMNTDRLYMDIQGHRLYVELYGWLIHHFLKLKDNYFGEDMHFKTLEEFQGRQGVSLAVDGTEPHGEPSKVSNDLDVILSIGVEEASVIIPANLYSAEDSLRADLPYASAELRFTNYYMDLMVNFSPISISLGTQITSPGLPGESSSGRTEIFVESIAVFGHRLFGLPPTEPTYVCNWDFDIGKISGECGSNLIERAVGAARSFAFTFDDDENTVPITEIPIIHDSTFLRLNTQDIHLWFHVATEALLFSAGPVNLEFNDLAGVSFSQRLNAWIPNLTLGIVDASSPSRHRTRMGEKQTVKTHAYLRTSVSFNMLKRKLHFTEERTQQQTHMQEHDQRTGRTPFMFIDYPSSSFHQRSRNLENIRSPAMQYPEIPHPIFLFQPREANSSSSASSGYYSDLSSTRERQLRASASRSTLNSSFAGSIRSTRFRRKASNASESSRSRTLLSSSPTGTESAGRFFTPLSEDAGVSRNLGLSSVALSSSLATPYFPLEQIDPDLSDVPSLPSLPSSFDDELEDPLFSNAISTDQLSEELSHTSLLISMAPGIQLYCTPEAIQCATNLFDIIQPERPEDLLDEFQFKVMMKILGFQKRLEGNGESIELNVRIPFTHIRFQNKFVPERREEGGKDQYDIILNKLKVAARIRDNLEQPNGKKSVSLHTTLGSLGVSVTERTPRGRDNDVAVQAEMRDLLVWMAQDKESSVNLSFRSFETATASRKIEFLASLIHRTLRLGEELGSRFEEINQRQQNRLHYLAWFLTSAQDQCPDPPFLTKITIALRSKDHLRNHDSWKIVSRLRYTWQCLPKEEQAKALEICSRDGVDCPECPKDAEETIISMWDKWRTWDLAHVKRSLAMRMLFGTNSVAEEATSSAPLYLTVRAAGMKFIVDPGPKQSEAALDFLTINVALLPPPEPTGLMLVGATPKRSTIVQINSRKSSLQIHWEICELIEVLINKFQSEQTGSTVSTTFSTSSQPTKEKVPSSDHDLHVIYVTDKAQVILDTVNLRSISTGQRFRFSFVDADSKASKQGEIMSAHVHLELAMTELISRSRVLISTQFDQPSLYFAQTEYPKGSKTPNAIKVAGASRMIRFHVREHVLGLIEVVDSVVRDEVTYFHRQATALKQSTKKIPEVSQQDDQVSQLPNINLALLMDAYQVDLSLLESLTWSVTGTSGRISVIPALGKNMMLRIDYDLESHVHQMHSSTGSRSHVVSSLELPPVNGRLAVTQAEKETKVIASGIIETINLQASEIQALIATINKPEISTVVHAIRDDVEVLKTHIEEIFPAAQAMANEASGPSRDVVFTVQMTLSGLNVLASAPGQYPESPMANLAIRLSSVQLKATNLGARQQIMASPEVIVQMHEISVEMTLSDAETIRRCGNLTFGAIFKVTAQDGSESSRRAYLVYSSGLEINVFADTASAVVDVMNHLQDKIKDLDLSKEKKYLKRLRHTKSKISQKQDKSVASDTMSDAASVESGPLFTSTYSLELLDIQISWIVGNSVAPFSGVEIEDLVLSFKRIELSTRKEVTARLKIEDTQLQMVPISAYKKDRSRNSALLPEMVFYVTYLSTKDTRSISLKAAGKSLDLLLDSRFVLPANVIERSIALAGRKFRTASANWSVTPTTSGAQRKNPFGNKRMAPLLVEASFAGAVVHINGSEPSATQATSSRQQQKGRYSQFVGDGTKSSMVLRAPGVELKVEYQDDGRDPALHAELRIDGSNNTLFPTVVPIIIDISESIKAVVREKDEDGSPSSANPPDTAPKPGAKLLEEDNLITADPSAILGRTRLNLGLRICKQEFSLSCQPIARVAAIAKLEDIYVTVNSVKSRDHGHFFAVSATFEKLQASVQHVYSRESTFGFDVESIILSMMNSKHLSGTSGISAILKINPMGLQINARQLQDFLLFREIWVPPEIRQASKPPEAVINPEPQEYLMQRYQQVTAATAFPWNANVAIADIKVDLDLGQAIGKSSLHIHNMWASSKKGTDWEQNLCIGVEKIGVESTGRTSGFVELSGVKVRTSISWPEQAGTRQSPLVQASLGFGQLRVKAGFDYQAFAIADIANFNFLMYNVREQRKGSRDRLVAILDGDKVQVFCHATSAAQGLALFQAIQRLVQENQQAYTQSLKDIEKFLRRKSSVATPGRSVSQSMITIKPDDDALKAPISLHTDVVVTLRSINIGVYPSKFLDNQILMLEAGDAQARFAVSLERGKIHSGLGMTLGQLSVALSSASGPKGNKPAGDLTVEDIVESARSARGGTILRVPKVIATMHTWQAPKSNHIDYVFKSSLEGKVDVGWNYSRISYIKTMWSNHSRTLASRLGKPLPESNIKITSSQQAPSTPSTASPLGTRPPTKPPPGVENQEKITAVVNVPQSKYDYTPLEPPIIETPQLRDMGEATPPLEWIGLHRDRLPNVTHQIVIVTLLEVAREVEDAYERILGTS